MSYKNKPDYSSQSDNDSRLSLDVGSSCSIYSRSAKKWCPGVIHQIFIQPTTKKEWLTIKYQKNGKGKIKKMQRFCKDLRVVSIKTNDDAKRINNQNNSNRVSSVDPKPSRTGIKEDDVWENNILTREEIAKHCYKNDCWLIISNVIYDVSHFLNIHPVSSLFILNYAGKDATNAMREVSHSEYAFELAKKYRIGILSKDEQIDYSRQAHKKQISELNWQKLQKIGDKAIKNKEEYKIKSIFIYPVKGLKGISVQSTIIKQGGLLNDRMYCIIDGDTNIAVNQLKYQKLCLIEPKLSGVSEYDLSENNESIKLTNTINNDSIDIPLNVEKDNIVSIKFKNSSTPILGYDQGSISSEWITAFIHNYCDVNKHKTFKFVKISKDDKRVHEPYFSLPFVDKNNQRIRGVLNYSSINLVSQESMDELNRRYKAKKGDDYKPFNIERFRVNFVIEGCPIPHFEDFCKFLVINNEIELLWNRRRYFCTVPNVSQFNGLQTMEPQNTLTPYRNAITLNDKTSKPGDIAVFFGSFYMIKHGGKVEIGDTVKTRKTQFNKLRTNRRNSYYGLNKLKSLNEDDDELDDDFKNNDDKKDDISLNYADLGCYNKYKLIKKDAVNHDCFLFTFQANNKCKHQSLKLKPGGHWMIRRLLLSSKNSLVPIVRAYTPIIHNDTSDDIDYFQLLIKIYPKGKMTQYLNKLKIGNFIDARVVYNKIRYIEIGTFQIGDPFKTMCGIFTLNINNINMICGGTGITPMYQIMTTIHLNKHIGDNTKINLFYANKTYKDILLLNELNKISNNNINIKIYYFIEKDDGNIDHKNIKISKIGRIDKRSLQKYAFKPTKFNDTICLFCGPDPMIVSMLQYCKELRFTEKFMQWFV